jgi:hypothetical protein
VIAQDDIDRRLETCSGIPALVVTHGAAVSEPNGAVKFVGHANSRYISIDSDGSNPQDKPVMSFI